ncbi:MAG: FAD-dependent 5-carboxymethylaminomethyl-2-thiouridine(34) oxidoreductase MnmC [Comamonas sp.]|uniref:FAD-dependent 5-carboxymethylaminomethyl-2-thiouridine(34) oxidoreductase MnmC n=1 Tax=Comamonas sp. TaxID=34028 RepID=UPI00283825B6|nr:FAD-dependent 5-carboxymethylaminomethyl-2-thiouridine(34) oxidoreductase MnmC [Comamonas sp.]MDR0214904.1 FAD-dependent 5-carboxymethylaminomethyl-2-thiouridine(34) oxidoreductase MnmC [Comamonas sp.]
MSEPMHSLFEGMSSNAQQWCALETDFGCGLSFLQTWAAWQELPERPRILHFVALLGVPPTQAQLQQGIAGSSVPQALIEQLTTQWWGLLPGVHRLSFEQGRVLLTLYIGDTQNLLRRQPPLVADGIRLSNGGDACWTDDALKNLARHCRRGTRLSASAGTLAPALSKLGFKLQSTLGTSVLAHYDPTWEPRHRSDGLPPPVQTPGQCLVLGAGLAGAAAASSLARRGWQVTVLDAAEQPTAGASGLPAGLFCPHVSPDDSLISRLSRNGVRTTLQNLQQLSSQQKLQPGVDWAHDGVLEHDLNQPAHLPPQWLDSSDAQSIWGRHWSQPATAEQLQAVHLPSDSHALWHAQAGWVRPAELVKALLKQPGIQWRGQAQVARLQRSSDSAPRWQALDDQGTVLAEAGMLVLALGPATAPLLAASSLEAGQWELQPIRGQVSVAAHDARTRAAMPPFPVNGHGNLVPDFPDSQGTRQWVMGSTFERDVTELPPSAADQQSAHASNGEKLADLLPACRRALDGFFGQSDLPPTWSRLRCAAYDRIPVTGPVGTDAGTDTSGLWVLTGLGSRGLTLSLLCAELMAAQLHGEPLPLDARLAQALGSARLYARASKQSTSK